MHSEIELKHGPESRWCLDCHDANSRDSLHLAGSAQVLELALARQAARWSGLEARLQAG